MKPTGTKHGRSPEDIIISPPVIESFFDPDQAAKVWTTDIISNKNYIEQTLKRRELSNLFSAIIANLPRPNMELAEAIAGGYVTADQVGELYCALSELLEDNNDYERLILYLPFEFLPSATNPPTGELGQAAKRFCRAYLKAWRNLLNIQDVRANFVDGDVLEVTQRTGDLPRVVKAAHLLPRLIQKGLLSVQDAINLAENSDDPLLQNSIAETLPVMDDLALLNGQAIERIKWSAVPVICKALYFINNKKITVSDEAALPEPITLAAVEEYLRQSERQLATRNHRGITAKRKKWLSQQALQQTIETLGRSIASAIKRQNLPIETVADFLSTQASSASHQALIEGIRTAIEETAARSVGEAQALYQHYRSTLLVLYAKNNPAVMEAIAKTFRRLYQLDLAPQEQLSHLGIIIPSLAGPFSDNLKLFGPELQDISQVVGIIESDPRLNRLLYPVVLAYGSRLKGYGEVSADIDLAVFVRPETAFVKRQELRQLLKDVLPETVYADDIVEFWLKDQDGLLAVDDLNGWETSVGESYWTHVLFGAAWVGQPEQVQELQQRLLTPYLYRTGKIIYGHNAKNLYLEELERDTLQYRLLHNGYQRFFPPCGGLDAPHAPLVDGQSAFWDSGYRQLATKLFLSRVFLPELSVG